MSNEFLGYDEALVELGLSRDELNDVVAQGELRAFHEGDEIRFKRDDVLSMKKSRETEPTIILSDTQADILSSPDDEIPIDLDSISTDETVLNIEGLLEDETEGTTPIPGAADLGDVGEDTVLDTDGIDLDDDFDLSDDDTLLADDDDTLLSSGGGPRQVQMVKKQSHAVMTALLAATLVAMLFPAVILMNLMAAPVSTSEEGPQQTSVIGVDSGPGVYPEWVDDLALLTPAVEGAVGIFGEGD